MSLFLTSFLTFFSSLVTAATQSYDFEVIGWYKKFREPGHRGDQSFFVRGKTHYEHKQSIILSQTNLTARYESFYWRIPESKIDCLLQQKIQLKNQGLEFSPLATPKKNCAQLGEVMQHLHSLLLAQLWPTETDKARSFALEGNYLWKKDLSQKGQLFLNTHRRRKTASAEEFDFSGELRCSGAIVSVRGQLIRDLKRNRVKKIITDLVYPEAAHFPEDTDRMVLLEIVVNDGAANE